MIRTGLVGMGLWGRHLVASVHEKSELIRFVAVATRTPTNATGFAATHGIRMLPSYEALLADPEVDAIVLATPHTTQIGRASCRERV